ncbi:MAG TPA: BREX-2 system phosphatase PglZ, partial [Polyangiaceae bacterium]|nr:BREX-2 system phosphatase PglZ [Polyangiaceae bacterium]
ELPELQPREIHDELSRIYTRGGRERHLHALFGKGQEGRLRVESVGDFAVVPVRSELELRERMPALEASDPKVVFLVPWQGVVPLDLAGRFENSRVRCIGPDRRLCSLCGALEKDDNVSSELVRYLLRPSNPTKRYPIAAGRITQEALWAVWLGTDWGLEVPGGIARDTLLAWAGSNGWGGRFVENMSVEAEPAAKGVREALLAYLGAALPPVGPMLWRAWEQGKGRELLEVALFCESLWSSQDPAVGVWLGERLKPLLTKPELAQRQDVARALGEAAPLAFRLLEGRLSPHEMDGILESADARVDHPEVRAALITSDRLPCAWVGRLEQLGNALQRGAEAPTVESVREAAGALKRLESHAAFQKASQTRAVKRGEMAVRLLAWLSARPDQALELGETDYADAVALGRWYAEEGGFVDWARRWARGNAEGALGRGAQAVVERVDRERAALDARFTKGLQQWVAAGRPSNQIVPIDQALKRYGVAFLEQNGERRLLVLLMDGMAWAQAVELLQSLGGRAHGWAPLAWHGMHRPSDGVYPAVFANLPTVTEVSRSAFFAGKEMPSGSTLSTQKDDERFRDNKALQPFCDEAAGPRLLLRAEGHTSDGSASSEALSLLADGRRRIVGVVVNAIDASLKGDTQQDHQWTVDSIRSLPDLLDAAREAGRSVLLVADHGHVPADRLRTLSAPGQGGARYRPWLGEGDALQKGELKFSGSGVYTTKGAQGVVLLATDDLRYSAAAHAGEHGGATLAEVVAPCVLIGWDEPGPDSLADKALKPRPAYVPDWWHFAVHSPVEVPRTPTPASVSKKRAKGALEGQLGLPQLGQDVVAPPAEVTAAPVAHMDGPIALFAACEMLKARAPNAARRAEVVQAVQLLLARGGALAAEVFAQHLQVLSFRVEGHVRGLQEVLNVDGYAVLRLDTATRQVFLDKTKLE